MNQTIPDIETFLNEWVAKLPQAAHIQEEHARRWHEAVAQTEPERFAWHFARLSGFGGSDIGELAAWKLGVDAQFKTPREIALSKLMVIPPSGGNAYTRRGTLLEDDIQRIFLEDYAGKSRPDLIEKIQQTTIPEHPWMSANVDDVVELADGTLLIADYKAPTNAGDSTALQYAAQVHQYDALLAFSRDGELRDDNPGADTLLIVPFDYAAGVTRPVEVPFDPAIRRAVIEAGDEVWQGILNGEVPDYAEYKADRAKELDFDEEVTDGLRRMESEWLRVKLLHDELSDRKKALEREMFSLVRENASHELRGAKLPFALASGSVRQTLDEEAVTRLLTEQGVGIESFQVPGKRYDPDAMARRLAELGEDPDQFLEKKVDDNKLRAFCAERGLAMPYKETLVNSLPRAKKKAELLAGAKEDACAALNRAIEGIVIPIETESESAAPRVA